MGADVVIPLPRPHSNQLTVLREQKRFNVLVCGRRWGKTTLAKTLIVQNALKGKLCAWVVPIYKDVLEVWQELLSTLQPVIKRKNDNDKVIELITGGKIEVWSLENKDATRGRKYHIVIVDEAAKCPHLEYTWNNAIRGTLTDYEGTAWFLSTPKGKANYFYDLYQRGLDAKYSEWVGWRMPTDSNPFIKPQELAQIRQEVGARVYAIEYEASFDTEIEGALWSWDWLQKNRVSELPELKRVVVAIDPAITQNANSNLTGIVVAGLGADNHGYILQDGSIRGSPNDWAGRAIGLYEEYQADKIVAEVNQGGDLVENTLRTINPRIPYKAVRAYRGKVLRAEPIAALYEQNKVHHFGEFNDLELQLTTWVQGSESPDRLDALVHALTELMVKDKPKGAFSVPINRGYYAN